MKRLLIAALLLASSGTALHASPSAHHGRPLGQEDFTKHRHAGKRLADLDTGEPREVRLVYFRPSDRPYQDQAVEQLKEMALGAQSFFAEQMDAHGYGPLTFALEMDSEGELVVHDVESQHADSHFSNDPHSQAFSEINQVFDASSNIYLAFIDNSRGSIARGGRWGKVGGTASTPIFEWKTVVHELGHAFGLEHDFRDDTFIMSYGNDPDRLSPCAAGYLSVHPYFNSEIPVSSDTLPSVELLSPPEYIDGQSHFSLEFQVGDPDGLHQIFVSLLAHPLGWAAGYFEVVACRNLAGETGLAEIEFDDPTPAYFASASREVLVELVGSDGDFFKRVYTFVEKSPYQLATWKSHDFSVEGVEFSPDGSLLAVASVNGDVKLWDVESQSLVRSLFGVGDVVFSPDGSLLATGGNSGSAVLTDLEANRSFVLEGHNDFVSAISFSFDGSLLAVGARDGTLKLWDVETRTALFTFDGHTESISHLSFTSDNSLLASLAKWTGTVRVWDVTTGERMDVPGLEEERAFCAVASSPESPVVVFSDRYNRIWTWNPESEERAAPLRGIECRGPEEVVFSPGGQILAVISSGEDEIQIWDLFTREAIAELGMSQAVSIDFSSDGRLLAAGGNDGAVSMWNVSEWTGRRPGGIVKVSGDDQRGIPGSELAEPCVIEVRDHSGDPLPGVDVIFRVISGGGEIGGYSVLEVTTDSDGLAEAVITLGPNPGRNTVRVFLGNREVSTFHALGAGEPEVVIADFHYPTWSLPDGAAVRLGRGGVGQGDRNVTFSADGQLLAVASAGGVWIYDVDDLRRFVLLPIRDAHSVSFSRDGRTVAVGAKREEGSLSLWDIETREQTASLGDGGWIKFLSFSPDGTRLVYGSSATWMKMWDAETENTTLFEGYSSPGTSAAFSPDGTILATGEEDGTIRLWDPETAVNTAVLTGHQHIVNSVSFSSDGTILAAASGDGTVGLWDPIAETRIGTLQGHDAHVLSVAFGPESGLLASGGWNGSLSVWNAITQQRIGTFTGHSGKIWGISFSPDGTTLASASDGGLVGLWDVGTGFGRLLTEHVGFIDAFSWSPDGSRIITNSLSWVGRVHLWDATTGQELAVFSGQDHTVRSFAFSPDGQTLITGSRDRAVFWDMKDFTKIAEVYHPVGSAIFSPDGQMLATRWRNSVHLWNADMTQELGSLSGFSDTVTEMRFSPDGHNLICGSYDAELKVWNLDTGEVTSLEGHQGPVVSLVFSSDRRTLVSVSREIFSERTIRWDLTSGAALSDEVRERKGSSSVSPDGRMLVTVTYDGEMQLSDFDSGELLASTEGPRGEVNGISFSPDGSSIATVEQGGLVLVWDVAQILPQPETLAGLSGDGQEGTPGTELAEALVVKVSDQYGDPFANVVVTFEVRSAEGTLSTVRDTTDGSGLAAIVPTLGSLVGPYTVVATVEGLEPVTFTANAKATPDFDGDGVIGLSDFFLFAEAFGGSDPRFDLDGSGSVNFADFFLLAESFGEPERAKLLALAHDRLGLPGESQLRQNAPNPFNGGTTISWFQFQEGPVSLDVFSLTGQRVAVLQEGPRKTGLHRLRWDGRDDDGRLLASGVYLYRLVIPSGTQTRKLTLLR